MRSFGDNCGGNTPPSICMQPIKATAEPVVFSKGCKAPAIHHLMQKITISQQLEAKAHIFELSCVKWNREG
jgi:hypothetical protein